MANRYWDRDGTIRTRVDKDKEREEHPVEHALREGLELIGEYGVWAGGVGSPARAIGEALVERYSNDADKQYGSSGSFELPEGFGTAGDRGGIVEPTNEELRSDAEGTASTVVKTEDALDTTPAPVKQAEQVEKTKRDSVVAKSPALRNEPVVVDIKSEVTPETSNIWYRATQGSASGEILSLGELIEKGRNIQTGQGGYMRSFNPSTGEEEVVFYDSKEDDFISAERVAISINFHGKMMEEVAGRGSAVALADRLSKTVAPQGQVLDPAEDQTLVITAVAEEMKKQGMMTDDDIERINDPEDLGIEEAVPLDLFRPYIKAGASLASKGESKMNVITSTLSTVVASKEFEKATTPKQKASILDTVYKATMNAVDGVYDENLVTGQMKLSKAKDDIGKALSQTASNPKNYEPISESKRLSLKQNNDKIQSNLTEIDNKINQANMAFKSFGKSAVNELNKYVNAKALLSELNGTRQDGAAIVADKINRIRDEDERTAAMSILSEYLNQKQHLRTIKTHRGKLVKLKKDNNDLITKGMPVNIDRLYNVIGSKASLGVRGLTDTERKNFFESVSDNVAEGDTDPERAIRSGLIYRTLSNLSKGQFRDMPNVLSDTLLEYQRASDRGDLSILPYGDVFEEEARRVYNQYRETSFVKGFENAKKDLPAWSQQFDLQENSATVPIKMVADDDTIIETMAMLDPSMSGKEQDRTYKAIKTHVVNEYGQYGGEIVESYLEPVTKMYHKLRGSKAIEQSVNSWVKNSRFEYRDPRDLQKQANKAFLRYYSRNQARRNN